MPESRQTNILRCSGIRECYSAPVRYVRRTPSGVSRNLDTGRLIVDTRESRDRRQSLRLSRERCIFLLGAVLIAGSATSLAQTETTADLITPGQAIPATNGVSPFAASVPGKLVPGILPLSLRDAIDRGLKQNLGLLLSNADIRAARGQRWEQLSALLPHVTAAPYIAESEINIDLIGFAGLGNRLAISSSIGPYSYFDARTSVTQALFDWKSINAAR